MQLIFFCVAIMLATCLPPTAGWGYIFSRFRPEAHNNWGFGGAHAPEHLSQPREKLLEALLGEELLEEELCDGRRCTSNERCCGGYLCVDFDGNSGSCMPSLGQKEGSDCNSDADCGSGLICEMGLCSTPLGKKHYNEACEVSSECDVTKGLCCQLVRRHRQAPRKLCGYFKDSLTCIGQVATDQITPSVAHSIGDKRLIGGLGPNYLYHLE